MDKITECQSCGQGLRLPANAEGKRARCPSCGSELMVEGYARTESGPPPLPSKQAADQQMDHSDYLGLYYHQLERLRADTSKALEFATRDSRIPANLRSKMLINNVIGILLIAAGLVGFAFIHWFFCGCIVFLGFKVWFGVKKIAVEVVLESAALDPFLFYSLTKAKALYLVDSSGTNVFVIPYNSRAEEDLIPECVRDSLSRIPNVSSSR